MQRRTLLKLGLGATALLTIAGGSVVLLRPALTDGRLRDGPREVMRSVALGVLDGVLPPGTSARGAALDAHLSRLEAAIAAFPAPVRAELSQLLALLSAPPGRLALAGLSSGWPEASVAQVQAALQGMRVSSLALKQQAYHALRDLTNAAYFSDPSAWSHLGYPGPSDL
ncbi:hypothetical protein [Variovorax sp. YR752]|uniref:hypothetical protein n=1 Tax=Variovorax sp. YR752 TaxID=1884383 RepID=UPI00313814BF